MSAQPAVQNQQHLRSLAFIDTRHQPPSGTSAASHQLLERAGFVKQSAAGVFMMLPLGLRVLERIEAVIDREMQALGAQKVQMPQLLAADLWKVTGRWETTGRELFRLQDRKVPLTPPPPPPQLVLVVTHFCPLCLFGLSDKRPILASQQML
jgi:prolyl-tRNA synthetase